MSMGIVLSTTVSHTEHEDANNNTRPEHRHLQLRSSGEAHTAGKDRTSATVTGSVRLRGRRSLTRQRYARAARSRIQTPANTQGGGYDGAVER